MTTENGDTPEQSRQLQTFQLPQETLGLGKSLYPDPLHFRTSECLLEFRRAANYISAGYWGISPAITLLYAHINLVIEKYDQPMILLVGQNYGVPAILSCLWLEGSLERFYAQYSRDMKGLHNLITQFSVPGGFPSHTNARIPGCIHEGGEVGHVLSVAYGTVLDKPNLITVAVVGDGEAETGPTATAWHMCKYINTRRDGALLPILYLNSYSDSQRTIFGSMDNTELCCLFSGYGYQPCIIDDFQDIDRELSSALSWAVDVIYKIQLDGKADQEGFVKARWPMIVLRLPKRWGYPDLRPEEHLTGSFHGREVLLPHAKINQTELQHLQSWLKTYEPAEILRDGEDLSGN